MAYVAALLGLFIGSFLNVLIDRLPKGEDVLWGRSHCDFCKKTLRWYELIPVASYVFQRGQCRRCHKKLSVQYVLVELVTAAGFVLLPPTYWLIFSSLLVIFMADLKYQIIPDSMVVLGIVGVLIQGQAFWFSALGAMAFFYALWFATKGRSMGFGDVKLAGFLGMLLGFPLILSALYIAFLTGAGVGVILILRGKKKLKSKIAFGPFMIFGAVVSIVFSNYILMLWKAFF